MTVLVNSVHRIEIDPNEPGKWDLVVYDNYEGCIRISLTRPQLGALLGQVGSTLHLQPLKEQKPK